MKKKRHTLKVYLYTTPSLVIIALVVLFPIIYTGYISLTNMNIYHWFDYKVIGIANYKRALILADTGFTRSLIITVIWTVLNIVVQLIIAFALALLLNTKNLKLKSFYKTILMFPWAMPGYVSILLWKTGMFNSSFGLLNQWLKKIGISPIQWLSNDITAFLSCTAVNLWLALPFMIMIIDGALQSVDRSYYESAQLDGAGWFKQAICITVPSIRPIIAPAVIITIFTTFKQFDIIYLLTQQAGAKTGANIHTVLTYVHENAFITNNYGYSSAISVMIFGMLILFTLFTRKELKGE